MHDSTEVATEMNMDLREVYIEEVTFGLEYVFEEEFIRKFRERTVDAQKTYKAQRLLSTPLWLLHTTVQLLGDETWNVSWLQILKYLWALLEWLAVI